MAKKIYFWQVTCKDGVHINCYANTKLNNEQVEERCFSNGITNGDSESVREMSPNEVKMLGAYVYFYSLNPHGKYVKDILKEMR